MSPRFPRGVIMLDLAICSLFAVPVISGAAIDLLASVSSGPVRDVDALVGPAGAFFVNFGGLLGVLLNVALLDPSQRRLHWSNVVARLVVVLLILWYFLKSDLPSAFLLFVATEIVGGLITIRWLRATSMEASGRSDINASKAKTFAQ